jgi:hypothetical protein
MIFSCTACSQVFKPVHAELDDMAAFHSRDYLEYLTVADRGKVWAQQGGSKGFPYV